MNECVFCQKKIVSDDLVIKRNANAIARVGNYFREGHCVVILKEHKKSVSELNEDEFKDIFILIKTISNAIEKIYNVEKTYVLSIGDKVEHLHFHLIPKHKDKCSMGVYCFEKLFEAEGAMKKSIDENKELRNKIVEFIEQ